MIASFNPFLVAEPGGAGDLVPDWVEEAAFTSSDPTPQAWLLSSCARAGNRLELVHQASSHLPNR